MLFEWNDKKDLINQQKHNVSFDTATAVFFDPFLITTEDKNSEGERRWQTVGSSNGIVVLLVVHTYRNQNNEEVVRIISARKLSKGEVKKYGYGTKNY
ncbi:MAG: BrnT family toxin [Moraxellaceae bacterium]|nr:BrnT family toxin [Moraxellaceae bacterium]